MQNAVAYDRGNYSIDTLLKRNPTNSKIEYMRLKER